MMGHCFPWPFTQIGDQALLAERATCHAHVASVQNQPVMGMAFVLCRYHAIELGLDLEGRLAGCHASPIADAEDVRIDGDSCLTKCNVEHDICRLSADPGQRLHRPSPPAHLT